MCQKDDIVLGLVSVANELPDKGLKREVIKGICSPFAQKICESAKKIPTLEGTETTEDDKNRLSLTQVCKNLEKLSLIVKNLTPAAPEATEHEMVDVVISLWPILHTFLLQFYVALSLTAGYALGCGGYLQVLQAIHALHQALVLQPD